MYEIPTIQVKSVATFLILPWWMSLVFARKIRPNVPEHGAFKGVWTFVSITPYGKDIEPNVPDKHLLIEHFKHLSMQLGVNSIG